ncbi:MAG: hypothetical protein WAL39_02645 [Xanthobacteraceae bacterium]
MSEVADLPCHTCNTGRISGLRISRGDAWVATMTLVEFFRTFAGPIATVIASVTAGGVAVWFGVVQARIARSQAAIAAAQKDIAEAQLKIAFDKLKHDLFDKRYEIYLAAKGVIEAIFNQSPVNDADPALKKLRLKLDEARFFFPPDTRAFCEKIEKLVYETLVASLAAGDAGRDRPATWRRQERHLRCLARGMICRFAFTAAFVPARSE